MKTQEVKITTAKNLHNLKVGDTIEFINYSNFLIKATVTKITDKSCYLNGGRNSWNTINGHFDDFDVTIKK